MWRRLSVSVAGALWTSVGVAGKNSPTAATVGDQFKPLQHKKKEIYT